MKNIDKEESTPLVSIIVACHNAENYIDTCFDSLLKQTYSNIEIVVCDDCSTDSSYSKLIDWQKKDSRIVVLKNVKQSFAAETRNNCFEASRGEYYLIQDIDDLSKPERTSTLLDILTKEKNIDFVSSQMEAFQTNPEKVFKVLDTKIEYPKKKHFLWGLPFNHPATMFTKKCIQTVGGYRVAEETIKGQDYDLFMRLYANGFKGKNISKALYLFRLDAENIKRRDFKARKWEYRIRKYGFKAMGLMPWGFIFTLKPFLAHFVQKFRYRSITKKAK